MNVSLADARFFDEKTQAMVRGPELGHDPDVIRRYFRAYLHCWKAILHFARSAKGLDGPRHNDEWVSWCKRWQERHLDADASAVMDQLRTTRDYDTHKGTIIVSGELAAGLFPLVFVNPIYSSQRKSELVTISTQGLAIATQLVATHAVFQ